MKQHKPKKSFIRVTYEIGIRHVSRGCNKQKGTAQMCQLQLALKCKNDAFVSDIVMSCWAYVGYIKLSCPIKVLHRKFRLKVEKSGRIVTLMFSQFPLLSAIQVRLCSKREFDRIVGKKRINDHKSIFQLRTTGWSWCTVPDPLFSFVHFLRLGSLAL